jgi:UDP:flavonoid glycosyltransferase YjiC (YdhE family)
MRLALLTAGTRGDTQPYVAIGRELARRGHEVRIAASEDHAEFIGRAGLDAFPYRGLRVREVLEGAEARGHLARGALLPYLALAREVQRRSRAAISQAVGAALEGADAVVAHPLTELAARSLARARGLPLVRTALVPIVRTGDFPSPLLPLPLARLPFRALRRATHDLVGWLAWRAEREVFALTCREQGLPVPEASPRRLLDREGVPTAHLVSPVLVPRPPDWGPHHVTTGHPVLQPEARERLGERGPSPELEAWLAAGPPPVYLGFGSFPVRDPEALLATAAEVTRRLGLRALVSAGWSRPGAAPGAHGHVFLAGALDHDAVLPRCLAAVHHGGLGTTTATLRAGLPTLVCAVLLDQPFWGARVRALGAGDVLPFRRLDARRLEDGVRGLLSPRTGARAREVAERMRGEDGVAAAADFVERHARPR